MQTETAKKPAYKLVKINQGAQLAVSLLHDQKGVAALVDFGTLQRIANLLRTASFKDVKAEFEFKLETCEDMDTYLALLANELAFHDTFNRVKQINLREVEESISRYEEPDKEAVSTDAIV